MRDLHLNYEAYVESKQPKDLAKTLKFTHIYDNIGHRSKRVFKKGKEKEPFSLKRKFFEIAKGGTRVSESFRGGQGTLRFRGGQGVAQS